MTLSPPSHAAAEAAGDHGGSNIAATNAAEERRREQSYVHYQLERLETIYMTLLRRPPSARELWQGLAAISTRRGTLRLLLGLALSRAARRTPGWFSRMLRTIRVAGIGPEFLRRGLIERVEQTVAPPVSSHDPATGPTASVPGLNVVGYLRAELGLGEAARALTQACSEAGIPWSGIDVGFQSPNRQLDDRCGEPATTGNHPIDLLYVNAPQTRATIHHLQFTGHGSARYTIGFWHWEQTSLPASHHVAFSQLDEVWVPSMFVQEAVAAISPVPVFRVPHAVRFEPSPQARRELFGLPADRLLVLVMYDFNSLQERKNPQAAIAAFRLAAAASPALALVVKTMNGAANPAGVAALQESLRDLPQATVIDSTFSRQQTWDLEACCDILLSLHRAEGFGLGPAEMMYLGKPVVATGWSANMDFMDDTNSMPVRYHLQPLEKAVGPYVAGLPWAEADIDHAAWCLRQLATDSGLAARLGNRARETIRTQLDPQVVGQRIRRRLEMIATWHPALTVGGKSHSPGDHVRSRLFFGNAVDHPS
jgi:glycosyltransferase involved in cell wall biosynthesis